MKNLINDKNIKNVAMDLLQVIIKLHANEKWQNDENEWFFQ